jgi:Lon protease-like protein
MSGKTGVNIWTDLPLFPLNTVLFPGMVLPLHIFEERYKLMINRCLEEERPFGVVLIREGKEVGSGAMPHEVGTTALIAKASRLDDGKMNIITIGGERFRIQALRHDQPYLSGVAEPWPLAGATGRRTREQVEPVRALFRQYLSLLVQAEGHRIDVDEVPTDARTLALLIAIALQLPMAQKQGLLAQATVAHMLRAERAIMRREQLLLHYMIETQTKQWEGGYSGYLARN